jgi:hypothetical protein
VGDDDGWYPSPPSKNACARQVPKSVKFGGKVQSSDQSPFALVVVSCVIV